MMAAVSATLIKQFYDWLIEEKQSGCMCSMHFCSFHLYSLPDDNMKSPNLG